MSQSRSVAATLRSPSALNPIQTVKVINLSYKSFVNSDRTVLLTPGQTLAFTNNQDVYFIFTQVMNHSEEVASERE